MPRFHSSILCLGQNADFRYHLDNCPVMLSQLSHIQALVNESRGQTKAMPHPCLHGQGLLVTLKGQINPGKVQDQATSDKL